MASPSGRSEKYQVTKCIANEVAGQLLCIFRLSENMLLQLILIAAGLSETDSIIRYLSVCLRMICDLV